MGITLNLLKIIQTLSDVVRDGEHLDFILAETFAERLDLQMITIFFFVSDAVDEVFQVLAEGVRFVIGYVNALVWHLNLIDKGDRVIALV